MKLYLPGAVLALVFDYLSGNEVASCQDLLGNPLPKYVRSISLASDLIDWQRKTRIFRETDVKLNTVQKIEKVFVQNRFAEFSITTLLPFLGATALLCAVPRRSNLFVLGTFCVLHPFVSFTHGMALWALKRRRQDNLSAQRELVTNQINAIKRVKAN